MFDTHWVTVRVEYGGEGVTAAQCRSACGRNSFEAAVFVPVASLLIYTFETRITRKKGGLLRYRKIINYNKRGIKWIISVSGHRFLFLEVSFGYTRISCGMYEVRETYLEGL